MLLLFFMGSRGINWPEGKWTPVELVTIILTALAVLMTTLAIFLAVAAFWGYNAIRDYAATEARRLAADVAKKVAAEIAEQTARNVAGPVAVREAQAAIEISGSRVEGAELTNAITKEGQ